MNSHAAVLSNRRNRSDSRYPISLLSLFWTVLLVANKSSSGESIRFSLDPRLSFAVLAAILMILVFFKVHLFDKQSMKSINQEKLSVSLNVHKDLSFLTISTLLLLGTLSSAATLFSSPTRIAALCLSILLIALGSKLPQEWIVKSIIQAAFALTLIGFVLISTGNQPLNMLSGYSYNPFPYRLQSFLMHPNVYGLFSSIALVLLVATRNKDKFRLITLIVGLALSENRAAIFGAILVIGLLKLTDIKESLSQKKGNSVRNATVITFGAIFSAYLTFAVFLKPRSGSQDLYTGRQTIWTECIGFIEASPWLGRGPDFFQAVFGQSNTNSLIAFHCHNQFLDISLNFGILTALLLVLILAYATKRTWNECSDYLGSVFILTLIVGLFEVPIRLFSTFQNYWVAIILLILWRAKPITRKSISGNLIRKQQFSS